ncbi:hypothetical protein JCM10295v2_000517 [Rhodotorula toruloides]
MGGTLQVVSSKTLPTASDLPANTLPPCASTSRLALLTSSPSSSDSKLALYRTSTTADLVWEWTPPPSPVDPSAGGAKPGGRLGLGLKGKGKAPQGASGKIEHVAWSPTGTAVVALVSPASASPPSNPSVALLSVQTGTPILPPIPLPAVSSDAPASGSSYLSWQALPGTASSRDTLLSSFSLDLIRRLPALPKIAKETLPSAGDAVAPGIGLGGARIGGPGGGGGGGVFGAKQAMLERERAKEAQRPLNLPSAIGGGARFPRLAATGGTTVGTDAPEFGDEAVKTALRLREGEGGRFLDENSVLCVGGANGAVDVFLGGSVYLGTLDVNGKVYAITVFPYSASDLAEPAISLLVHHSTSFAPLTISRLTIPTPSTLAAVLHLSTALSAHFEHAFEALQGARNMWDEARRIGKGWLQRIADVSRPHGVKTPPTTQLHLLLLTGRPTRSLHDFLASKMNERVLVKWEQAMGAALERLRKVAWMSIIPALERVIVMLKEVEAWSIWPDKFATYDFSRTEILQVSRLAREAIAATARMQREVEEEERCFKQFSVWLRFELDKVAQQEGSEIRPLANFLPMPVSHYIRHCLPSADSQISPYVSFGLATAPLSANGDLRAVQVWLDSLAAHSTPSDHADQHSPARDADQSLREMLKRMGEELRGQVDASELEGRRLDHHLDLADDASPHATSRSQGHDLFSDTQPVLPTPAFAASHAASALDPEYEVRLPSRFPVGATASTQVESAPTRSIPVFLHLAVQIAAGLMDRAVRRATGDRAARSVAEVPDIDQELYFSKRDLSFGSGSLQRVLCKLATSEGVALRPMQFDFSGTQEAIFAFRRPTDGTSSSPFLAIVDLSALAWDTSPAASGSLLPLARQSPLDEHFPPTAVAFSRYTDDVSLVATVAGEGRRFEILNFAADGTDIEMLQL